MAEMDTEYNATIVLYFTWLIQRVATVKEDWWISNTSLEKNSDLE